MTTSGALTQAPWPLEYSWQQNTQPKKPSLHSSVRILVKCIFYFCTKAVHPLQFQSQVHALLPGARAAQAAQAAVTPLQKLFALSDNPGACLIALALEQHGQRAQQVPLSPTSLQPNPYVTTQGHALSPWRSSSTRSARSRRRSALRPNPYATTQGHALSPGARAARAARAAGAAQLPYLKT